jgi:hypothetical protein
VVATVERKSPTSITIRAVQTGVTITIRDGVAAYHDVSYPNNTYYAQICIAKASCAAVSVRTDEAVQLAQDAITSIYDAGFAVPPSMIGYWTGLVGSNHTPWARRLTADRGNGRRLSEAAPALCSNTCASSNNGVCEDGGPNAQGVYTCPFLHADDTHKPYAACPGLQVVPEIATQGCAILLMCISLEGILGILITAVVLLVLSVPVLLEAIAAIVAPVLSAVPATPTSDVLGAKRAG